MFSMSEFVGLVILSLLASAYGYGNGAPRTACRTLAPRHYDVEAQQDPSPYTLVSANGNTYFKPGEPFRFRIKGDEYAGFMFEVRDADKKAYGAFQVDTETENARALDCSHKGSAITHTSSEFKTENDVDFVWVPPTDLMDTINELTITGSIAKSRSKFWIEQSLVISREMKENRKPQEDNDSQAQGGVNSRFDLSYTAFLFFFMGYQIITSLIN